MKYNQFTQRKYYNAHVNTSGLSIKKSAGISLVEVMVAMVIAAVLLTGVIQLFISNKQTYRTIDSLSRVQENGRFAMEFLTRDLRQAGFMGCRSRRGLGSGNINIIADPAPDSNVFDLNGAISGQDNVTSHATAVTGTDIVSIQLGGSCGGTLTGNMSSANANIFITAPNSCSLEQGGYFMISDCVSADIGRISNNPCNAADGWTGPQPCSSGSQTASHANNVNISNRLSRSYQGDAEIFGLNSFSYEIRPSPNNSANGSNSLYRVNNVAGTAEELVEGIENMQVLYGEDTDNDDIANRYVPAGSVTDMNEVVSVKISLLVTTLVANVSTENQVYDYEVNGSATSNTASDGRLRRVFGATVALRNL